MTNELIAAVGETLLPWYLNPGELNTGEDAELERRRKLQPTSEKGQKETVMGLAVIPSAAKAVATALQKAPPAVLARIAPRLSLSTAKATADNVIRVVKNNKISTALVAYELWGPASDILKDVIGSDEQAKQIIEAVKRADAHPSAPTSTPEVISVIADMPITPVPPALKYELEEQRDENEMISFAISRLGSLENVETLWRVFHLTPAHFASYRQIRAAGKGLR